MNVDFAITLKAWLTALRIRGTILMNQTGIWWKFASGQVSLVT